MGFGILREPGAESCGKRYALLGVVVRRLEKRCLPFRRDRVIRMNEVEEVIDAASLCIDSLIKHSRRSTSRSILSLSIFSPYHSLTLYHSITLSHSVTP